MDKLKENIVKAVKESFLQIIKNNTDIYGFALYSDENCETLAVSVNTFEYLKETKERYGELDTDHYSKYSPEEWDYKITENIEDSFKEINLFLSKQFKNISMEDVIQENKFLIFQDYFYNLCIDVLINLKKNNFFYNNYNKEIFVTFIATEYEFENQKIKEIITSLNDNEYGNEYIKWMETWEE